MKQKVISKTSISKEPFYLIGNRPLLIIFIVSFLIYVPTLWFGFSPMDEQWVILKHADFLSHFNNLPQLFAEPTLGMYYRPVWTSSFLMDMVVGNGSPGFFHFTNILIHVFCCLLLYRIFIQLKLSQSIAFFAALIFAVHPINVHTVAWIPGRNDSLLCLFTILSVSFLLSYFESRRKYFLIFHLLAFALALLTKENAIVLPVVFFLAFFLRSKEKGLKSIIPLLASWVLLATCWFFLRKHFIDYFPPVSPSSLSDTLLHFGSGMALYIAKVILPVNQSVMPVLADTSILPFAIIGIVTVIAVWRIGLRDKKIALFGLSWFLIFLVIPVWVGATNTNGEHYEHRVYTSLVGALLFLSQLKITINPAIVRKFILTLLIAFSFKTIARSQVYKNEKSFAEAATVESSSVYFFYDMLGNLYSKENHFEKAIRCYSSAIELSPHKIELYNHRANALFEIKDYVQAKEDDDKALELKKDQPQTMVNRSMANYYLGLHSESLADLQNAQQSGATNISQKFIDDLYNAFQNDTIKICTRSLVLDSTDASAYNQRGICYIRLNQPKAAIDDFMHALQIKPSSIAFKQNLNLATQLLQKNRN